MFCFLTLRDCFSLWFLNVTGFNCHGVFFPLCTVLHLPLQLTRKLCNVYTPCGNSCGSCQTSDSLKQGSLADFWQRKKENEAGFSHLHPPKSSLLRTNILWMWTAVYAKLSNSWFRMTKASISDISWWAQQWTFIYFFYVPWALLCWHCRNCSSEVIIFRF